jgi:hypothetical protein
MMYQNVFFRTVLVTYKMNDVHEPSYKTFTVLNMFMVSHSAVLPVLNIVMLHHVKLHRFPKPILYSNAKHFFKTLVFSNENTQTSPM